MSTISNIHNVNTHNIQNNIIEHKNNQFYNDIVKHALYTNEGAYYKSKDTNNSIAAKFVIVVIGKGSGSITNAATNLPHVKILHPTQIFTSSPPFFKTTQTEKKIIKFMRANLNKVRYLIVNLDNIEDELNYTEKLIPSNKGHKFILLFNDEILTANSNAQYKLQNVNQFADGISIFPKSYIFNPPNKPIYNGSLDIVDKNPINIICSLWAQTDNKSEVIEGFHYISNLITSKCTPQFHMMHEYDINFSYPSNKNVIETDKVKIFMDFYIDDKAVKQKLVKWESLTVKEFKELKINLSDTNEVPPEMFDAFIELVRKIREISL